MLTAQGFSGTHVLTSKQRTVSGRGPDYSKRASVTPRNPVKRAGPGRGAVKDVTADAELRARRALLQRVADSQRFQKSPRLRDFLLYVCENALTGQLDGIHEQQIGHRVYGRKPDYNTSDDNIVRVEARRLRRELAAWFEDEGRGEEIAITIPKGSYLPVFEPRELRGEPETASNTWFRPALVAAVALLCLLVGVWIGRHSGEPVTGPAAEGEESAIWPVLLDPRMRTFVVLPDASFSLIQDVRQRLVPLEEYTARGFADSAAVGDLRMAFDRQFVGLGSVLVVSRILALPSCPKDRVSLVHASNLNVRALQNDNFILIGSRHSNPWVEVFEEKRNFRSRKTPGQPQETYTNVVPRDGEAANYGGSGRPDDQFAVVAYFPNLSGSGNVLMLEGTGMVATEAAWAFLSDRGAMDSYARKYGLLQPDGKLGYFEALLRARSVSGAPTGFEHLAHRAYPVERIISAR